MADVYVVAILGTSPGVLTNLLWLLAAREAHRVVGVELWTTGGSDGGGGLGRLKRERHGWDALSLLLGDRIPALPADPQGIRPEADGGPPARPGVRVFVPWVGSDPIDDVANHAEATRFAADLHARVRSLARDAPAGLIGSLAGGRKTMSASLQSAFTLFGRPHDRLVHVLVHPTLEAAGLLGRPFPTAEVEAQTGVPMAEQVTAHDVPFPLVGVIARTTLPPLAEALDRHDYEALWGRLREVATAPPRARLAPEGDRWALVLSNGLGALPMTALQAQIYEALRRTPDGATEQELDDAHQRLGGIRRERKVQRKPSLDDRADEPTGRMRKRLEELEDAWRSQPGVLYAPWVQSLVPRRRVLLGAPKHHDRQWFIPAVHGDRLAELEAPAADPFVTTEILGRYRLGEAP